MRGQRVAPIQVGAVARNGTQSALLRRVMQIAGEIAPVQVFSVAMERHFARIKRKNSCDADEDRAHLGAGPVVGPRFHVEDRRIVLGDVRLADAAQFLLPRDVRRERLRRGRACACCRCGRAKANDSPARTSGTVAAAVFRNLRRSKVNME